MSLRNLTIGGGSGGGRPVNPRDIFAGLTLRGGVQNLWTPQSEALDLWFAERTAPDLIIEMATGGGKTLVGLLAAQSTCNEARGKVLYLCANNQLVEQTMEKAAEIGLPVAAYHASKWHNRDAYAKCDAPCITNYASAFTAHSTFRSDDIAGLILDDAHVAVAALRSQFTLKIPQKHPAFGPILEQLRPYFVQTGRALSIDQAAAGDQYVLLVPAFVFLQRAAAIANILKKKIADDDEQKWPWQWLSEKLDRCIAMIGPDGIEFAPAVPPVHAVTPYRNAARRILLTATLPSVLELGRVFGLKDTTKKVQPTGKLGAAQRQILFMRGTDAGHHRQQAADLIKSHKACVIVGTHKAVSRWPGADVFGRKDGHDKIKAFAAEKQPQKIVLVNRFDGVDLPGDACRVLVLDGLPRGAALVERFLVESVRIYELRASTTAARIVQALGRIFRSNTDHGVVVLCGTDLHDWLKDPKLRRFLPPLLQQQVVFGIELANNVDQKRVSFVDLMDGVLTGSSDWDDLYNRSISGMENLPAPTSSSEVRSAFMSEHLGYKLLWNGDFSGAAQHFAEGAQRAEGADEALAAWMWHLAGMAHQKGGAEEAAGRAYLRGASFKSEMGRPDIGKGARLAPPDPVRPSPQANALSRHLAQPQNYGTAITRVRAGLTYATPAPQVEAHLRELGDLLGLKASRPEQDHGTGPDVLWESHDSSSCAVIEAKTGKQTGSMYTKGDIGQFHDHVQWVIENRPGAQAMLHIVGALLQVSDETNPPPTLHVAPLESFVELVDRLRQASDGALADPAGATPEAVERNLRAAGLNWPRCVSGIASRLATDLQGSPADSE